LTCWPVLLQATSLWRAVRVSMLAGRVSIASSQIGSRADEDQEDPGDRKARLHRYGPCGGEDHLTASPGTDEPLRRSLVTVLAHIAGTYWLDPADEGMELRPGAQPSHHAEARP
jgi:hypothetical protein